MKPEVRELKQESTLDGEGIDLSIDAEDMPFIYDLLTDLYSDREMACVREYSTNALDAHVEAGQTRPIEVTIPSPLAPYLRIKDFGLGLDEDDIRKIYAKYGKSTKRDSNDVQGMLGLGGKSALTYTDQYSISSVKNGIKYEVMVSRKENGGGEMRVEDEYETDEPNSVEIIIPVTKYHSFEEKVKEFFQYWKRGTVLVNGEEPTPITEKEGVFKIDDDLYAAPSPKFEDKIVMGNVAYPFPNSGYEHRSYSIIAFLPIGSVDFVPSREELTENKRTTEAVANVKVRVKAEINAAITREVQGAANRREALLKYYQTTGLFGRIAGNIDATYKGTEIPMEAHAAKDQEFVIVRCTSQKGYRDKGWARGKRFSSKLWPKTFWIIGYSGADFSPFKRKKMDQWRNENELAEPEYYVFCKNTPHRSWIDPNSVHKWEDIEAQKITVERTGLSGGSSLSGWYEGYLNGNFSSSIQATDIDTNEPIFYVNKTHHGSNGDLYQFIAKSHPKHTFVQLASNRVAKFKRDFPSAKELTEYGRELADAWSKKLSEDDKLWLAIRKSPTYYQYEKLRNVVADDPDLNKTIKIANRTDAKLQGEFERHGRFLNGFLKNVKWDNPLENYPLFAHMNVYGTMSGVTKEHVEMYLNAAYAAGQEDDGDE